MAQVSEAPAPKLGFAVLAAMVVGSMVGAGVFNLPGRFATATGVVGAIIAWVIAGSGMLMLALVFQSLAVRKPDLDAGVFAYAKAAKVPISDTGTASIGISVARQVCRNSSTTITTSRMASNSVVTTFSIDCAMKMTVS